MIEIKHKQWFINDVPTLLMSGEIHYFRLPVEEWEDRIDKLILAGCNTVASYVPWICHEEEEGIYDFQGNLDLGRFIDLCHEKGLYFFLRPGPFIMAEMKNEGIPYWLTKKHPEIIPITWDGLKTPSATIDYLAPAFLQEVSQWIQQVMRVVKPRLFSEGGNIIGIQLDNEIGMLSWVTNAPDLTENVIADFTWWLKETYDKKTLNKRYREAIQFRSPKESYALAYMHDLGLYNRHRFTRYVQFLKERFKACGAHDTPFLINIHGTSEGRGLKFPIGISQLMETYQDEEILSGTDIYFGDLTVENFHDLYLINAFTEATTPKDKPTSSIEFNCGDGNFGDNLGSRYDPSSVDFKARMCIAQGNRLINYYLMTGGYNYKLKKAPHDGNDRMATTGERHGFAAPINPEGKLSYVFPRMKQSIHAIMGNEKKLNHMTEEWDQVSFGFIPDYFMTESYYPKSIKMKAMIANLEMHRVGLAWDIFAKGMLLLNYRFGATNLQDSEQSLNLNNVLVLPSALYMSENIQTKLVHFLNQGGRILLGGELPIYDLEGNSCTHLIDALQVKIKDRILNHHNFHLSVTPLPVFYGKCESRTHYAQTFELPSHAIPLFKVTHNEEICGFERSVGIGKAIVIATHLTADLEILQQLLSRLGVKNTLNHTSPYHGIFMTTTKNEHDERYLHLINLDGFDKTIKIYEQDQPLFDGKEFTLFSKEAVMLPLNMNYEGLKMIYSTAEISHIGNKSFIFRLTQPTDFMVIETDKTILPNEDIHIEKKENRYSLTAKKHALVDSQLIITFK